MGYGGVHQAFIDLFDLELSPEQLESINRKLQQREYATAMLCEWLCHQLGDGNAQTGLYAISCAHRDLAGSVYMIFDDYQDVRFLGRLPENWSLSTGKNTPSSES